MVKLLEKLGSLASGITTTHSYNEVLDTLEKLKDSGKKVHIKFQGDEISYTSSVCALNAQHRVFVLENLYPTAPASYWRKGRTISVTTAEGGKTIHLDSKFLEPLMERQNAGFQMRMPRRLRVASIASEPRDFSFLMNHRVPGTNTVI